MATGRPASRCDGIPNNLIPSLQTCLHNIARHEHPHVAGPESVTRRASVALILRIQPSYAHWPSDAETETTSLESFFDQEWVKHGEPEVCFMRRAARKGDRWTSHIALPGGKRELDNEDDRTAAVRETYEEIGIDLDRAALYVGNLPQRLVSTQWGQIPLMVLCPFLFILTRHTPEMRLQPTEVASVHWIPLRDLLSSEQRTLWHEDVSNRLAKQEAGFRRWLLGAMFGKMTFAAVRLRPTQSLYCYETTADDTTAPTAWLQRLTTVNSALPHAKHQEPLILWGLTLGVLTDFLYLLPPHDALKLWSYPSLTPWDIRFTIWAMSSGLRTTKARFLPPTASAPDGLDFSAVTWMLDGYYHIVRRAAVATVAFRTSLATGLVVWACLRSRRLLRRP